jgi:cyclopropane fatty-acyl-phospholipid synthase-like methyltransferase
MENKIFKLADIRKLNKQVSLGEISALKMVEILNEMAYKYYIDKAQNVLDGFTNEAPGEYIKTNFIELLNKY